jgi:hypothetical protein
MVIVREAMVTSGKSYMNEEGLMVATTGASRHAAYPCRSLCGVLVAALLVQSGAMRTALAQEEPSSAETAAARGLAVEGLKLADAGKCSEAVDKLARAEKLHHSAIVQGRLGECQITLGKLVDGTENLRKVLREPVPSNPSPALVKARDRAQSALDGAKPKIAFLMISVKGPKEISAATVTVDGESVPPALLDADRPTDPGEHVIEASAPGYLKASARVSVKEAERKSVSVRLDADPSAIAPPPLGAAEPAAGQQHSPPREPAPPPAARETRPSATYDTGAATSTGPNRTGAYIALAVGGVALAVGAGFGAVALKAKNDLDAKCHGTVCSPSESEKLSDGKTAGNISTVAFIAGGAGIALGTVLFLTASPSTSASSGGVGRVAAGARPAGTSATGLARFEPRAFIGVGQVALAGSF